MSVNIKRVFLLLVVVVVAIAGCPRKQKPQTMLEKELPVLSMDAFLSKLNASARSISSAPTTVLRDDAIKQLDEEARSVLQSVKIEAVVTIRDVKMQGGKKATISVIGLHIPSLAAAKDPSFNVNLAGTVDLPLSPEQARGIRPGQKLLLRGSAGYHSGTLISISFPRPRAFARIHFKNAISHGAVITLVPENYAILDP